MVGGINGVKERRIKEKRGKLGHAGRNNINMGQGRLRREEKINNAGKEIM